MERSRREEERGLVGEDDKEEEDWEPGECVRQGDSGFVLEGRLLMRLCFPVG